MSSLFWLARCTRFGCTLGFVGAFANGCSDPVTTPPQAAFEATFSGSSCAATVAPGPTISIGVATKDSASTYANGTEGIFVGCRVVPQGSDFSTVVKISRGSTTFNIEALIPNDPNKPAEAKSLTVSGPNTAGSIYVPSNGTTCTVHFLAGAPGMIRASFDCPSMFSGNSTDLGATCALSGYVAGEACTQE